MKIIYILPFLFGFLPLGAITGAHHGPNHADTDVGASAAPALPELSMPRQLRADTPEATGMVPLPAYVPERDDASAWSI